MDGGPEWDRATLDLRKLTEYCFNPSDLRGRHRARVFEQSLGIGREDAPWLQAAILEMLPRSQMLELESDRFGARWRADLANCATWEYRRGKNRLARRRRPHPQAADMLGVMMNSVRLPAELDVVALLSDIPDKGILRGQVGTVIETLGEATVLVEFSDDNGRALAILPCPRSELLALRYEPEAA